MDTRYKTMMLPVALALASQSGAAATTASPVAGSAPSLRSCTSVKVDTPAYVTLGKSSVIPLDVKVSRILVNGQPPGGASKPVPTAPAPAAASPMQMPMPMQPGAPAANPAGQGSDGVGEVEVMLLSPTDLFFRGKKAGSMNVIMQNAAGACFIKDIVVTADPNTLQAKLNELLPSERQVRVRAAETSLILTGEVSDSVKLDEIVGLANAYADGKKVVNMLRVTAPQQVMLEVTIAEVGKNLLDKFGSRLDVRRSTDGGANVYSLLSSFLTNGGGLLDALKVGRTRLTLDGQKDDGLVRVLAEPNIMAISGQQASFLSGGKIFIPVAQQNLGLGGSTITLEEKEFGIGVKFTPTVLEGGRINLKMVSEVSDLSQTGSPFTTFNGVTSVLPSLTVRRADTTVQLGDGQSFVIAGLIKNNVTETIKRFPGVGEVPVLGTLFKSSEFQNDQSELLFVITPRLVKPLSESPRLPTDNHVVPSRAGVILGGAVEGRAPARAAPVPAAPGNPNLAPVPAAPVSRLPADVTPAPAAPISIIPADVTSTPISSIPAYVTPAPAAPVKETPATVAVGDETALVPDAN